MRGGVLYAVRFDPARLEVVGNPVQVVDDMASVGTQFAAPAAFSATGMFGYATGRVQQAWPVAWYDTSGVVESLPIPPGAYYTPRVSPDGNRVALSVDGDRGQDVFVYDIRRDVLTRLTFTGQGNLWPVWAPDGKRFLILPAARQAEGARAQVTFMVNFFDELRRRLPAEG